MGEGDTGRIARIYGVRPCFWKHSLPRVRLEAKKQRETKHQKVHMYLCPENLAGSCVCFFPAHPLDVTLRVRRKTHWGLQLQSRCFWKHSLPPVRSISGGLEAK